MKKMLLVSTLSLILILFLSTSSVLIRNTNLTNIEARKTLNNKQIVTKEAKDQVYYDLFITMLYPYVEKAIANYYDEYMTYLPREDLYSYEFIKIERFPGENYTFTIILEVHPFVGPHLSVGRDRITFNIDLKGVKIEKFEHIESYELPPHCQEIIKKKLPIGSE